MSLDYNLIYTDPILNSELHAVLNAHGLYNTEQFVLRLSPRNHELIEEVTNGKFTSSEVSNEAIQAYSTYLHETIHWWQHIGSNIGFVLSLCYPNQTYSNADSIREWVTIGKAEKSIRTSALSGELSGKTHADRRQALANSITNNALDFELFRAWVLNPNSRESIYKDPYFESQGHCFHVAYSAIASHVGDIIDDAPSQVPDIAMWAGGFASLKVAQERVKR